MLAYMDEKTLNLTLETGKTWFFSRSRNKYWMKGKQSGNVQEVMEVYTDCDADRSYQGETARRSRLPHRK